LTLTVFFDGGCPLCKREIGLYQRASAGLPIHWLDVSLAETLPAGLSPEAAMARFHVLLKSSGGEQLLSGAKAFTALWRNIPGWRWLGVLGGLPIMVSLLEMVYSFFLHIRPQMQAVAHYLEPAISQSPDFMVADLRSDHAGETGAVWIYKGVLAGSKMRLRQDGELATFAQQHLQTEQKHLRTMQSYLPWRQRSRLITIWRFAGFLTGFLPSLISAKAVYATVAAVETFVEKHYEEQIAKLQHSPYTGLLNTLKDFQADEVEHKHQATAAIERPISGVLKVWTFMVGFGSAQAVKLARLI
jgi:3-demethoxyubiquinol 3-hydroxylase